MKRIEIVVLAAFAVWMFAYMPYRLARDFNDPKRWEGKAHGESPYVYGPMYGGALAIVGFLAVRVTRDRCAETRRKAEFLRLTLAAKSHIRAGQWEAAEAAIAKARATLAKR